MEIQTARRQFTSDSFRLRRARRLYLSLIYKDVLKSPDLIYICAQRAVARGLYSHKTGYRDVVFLMARGVFKFSCYDGGWCWHRDWHKWKKENHVDLEKNLIGKPRLRIVA